MSKYGLFVSNKNKVQPPAVICSFSPKKENRSGRTSLNRRKLVWLLVRSVSSHASWVHWLKLRGNIKLTFRLLFKQMASVYWSRSIHASTYENSDEGKINLLIKAFTKIYCSLAITVFTMSSHSFTIMCPIDKLLFIQQMTSIS